MKKNEKGITLIALTVTIIVLIILASVGITSGISTVRSSMLTKFTAEMKKMQLNVNELYNIWKKGEKYKLGNTEYEGNAILNIGKDLIAVQEQVDEAFRTEAEGGSGITETNGYRYFDLETMELLGLKDIEQEFFVNIETRNIISVKGLENEGKKYYTLEQLPDGLYNVEYEPPINELVEFDVEARYISNTRGIIYISNITYNGPINSWQVRYRQKGVEQWRNQEEFIGNETKIELNKSGTYEIQVYHDEEAISEIREVIIQSDNI